MAVGDAPASVVHRAAEASRHPVARRLAGAIPAAVVAVAQHPAGRRSAGLVACQVAEEEVAEEEVLSAGHATAPPRPVEAAAVAAVGVAVLRDARVRPLQEAAVGVPAARHAVVLPLPGVAEAGEPVVQHVALARPREVAAVRDAAAVLEALEVPEAAAVPEDAEEQPRVVAAAGVEALRDAAGQPAEVAAVPGVEVLRPAGVAAAELADVVVQQREGAPAVCPEPAAGRLSVAVSVCHRGRPRPAARPPGPRRRARPGQRKGSSQSTSLSVRSWQAAPNEFWSCDFRSRNHFGEGEER